MVLRTTYVGQRWARDDAQIAVDKEEKGELDQHESQIAVDKEENREVDQHESQAEVDEQVSASQNAASSDDDNDWGPKWLSDRKLKPMFELEDFNQSMRKAMDNIDKRNHATSVEGALDRVRKREEMDIKVCERFLGTKRKQCILDDDKKQAPKDDDVEGKQKMLRLMRKIDQDHGYENPEDPESLQEDS